MLLTITCTGENALDLGYLLYKHPARPQVFELNFGKVYVFYPEASETRCTAALLLDIDPLDLARGKLGSKSGGIFDYVNDRPYVSSSFMSVALARVFGTALSGKCEKKQDAADRAHDFTAAVTMLPCRGDTAMLERVFAPLGYGVSYTTHQLDEQFPEWGQSRYVNLTLSGAVRLCDLLRHLYVLMPVFDRQKHYWIGRDEVDKLLHHGEGWLDSHPEKEFIAGRYFNNQRRFSRLALDRLTERAVAYMDNGAVGGESLDDADDVPMEAPPNLNTRRLKTVRDALKNLGAHSVLDLGCGEGHLLQLLVKEKSFERIAGADVSLGALSHAADRLKTDTFSDAQRKRLSLFQGSALYRDKRFAGFDAIACVEVIEHMDPARLGAFASVIFGTAHPASVIVTTPNREYNVNYTNLAKGQDNPLRHGDHRFEWTRGEFRAWADAAAVRYGYRVRYEEIGDADEVHGAPTQMGVFSCA